MRTKHPAESRPADKGVGNVVTMYKCPRGDLGCTDVFQTTGDLDWHCHQAHGYRHTWRMVSSLSREIKLPIGPEPSRRVPDGLETGPGSATMRGLRGSATAAETARAKHRGRGKAQAPEKAQDKAPETETAPVSGRAKHRPGDGGRRAAKAGRGKHAANS